MKSRLTTRIFCPVNESQKVTIVEVAEAVCLVNSRNRSSNPLHDLGNQLETHIHSLGADMKQRISGSRDRVAFPRSYFAKRMELCRPGLAEEPVPSIRPKPRDTREPSLDATEIDRSKNSREISAQRAHSCVALTIRLNTNNQEYRCAGEWCKNRLRNRCWLLFAGYAHTNTILGFRRFTDPPAPAAAPPASPSPTCRARSN